MTSVVVTTRDVVGERMAGPGIRAYFLARELAKHFPTTLIAQLVGFEPAGEAFEVHDNRSIPAHNALQRSGIVIGQPDRQILGLSRRRHKLVFDLFDPNVLELRELYGLRPRFRQSAHLSREWGRLRMALSRGDLLMAGHRRQIDFYSGVHSSTGGDTSGAWLDRWIEVPFGIEESRPHPYPPDDPPTILWGGGVWEWLDPELAVDAVIEANRRDVRCRLLFLGSARPNSEVSGAGSTDRIEVLARTHPHLIHLNREWVRYRDRDRWLRSCKAAIMLHRRTLEAEFSLRTRLFDALWCRIPVIASDGGFAAGLVREEEVGLVVEPSNLESVTQAIVDLVTDDAFHKRSVSNLERIRSRFFWSEVTRPLIQAISAWQ